MGRHATAAGTYLHMRDLTRRGAAYYAGVALGSSGSGIRWLLVDHQVLSGDVL